LAAKQGVSEDELLTSPEEHTETPPDWVLDTVQEDGKSPTEQPKTESQPELTEDEISEWMSKVPESDDTPEVESPANLDDADAAMAWLESLAAKQGVPEEELLSSPEERADTPPDWVQDTVEEETPVDTAHDVAQPTEISFTPEEIPSPEVEDDAAIAPPSWIADGDIPEEDADFSWIQSAVTEEADQLLDLNQASLIQLERLPGIGFRRAQSITAFRSQQGDFLHLEELLNVPGMDEDTYELLKSRVYVTAPEQLPETETAEPALFDPQEADPDDAIHEQQIAAQAKINEGNIGEAMSDYAVLIKKGQRLDEIIADLNLASEKYPEDSSIVQTLGDAYMQANRLQEALDAYTKAGELLR
jgi:competence ComEA-like helix-hairpin-helix protein